MRFYQGRLFPVFTFFAGILIGCFIVSLFWQAKNRNITELQYQLSAREHLHILSRLNDGKSAVLPEVLQAQLDGDIIGLGFISSRPGANQQESKIILQELAKYRKLYPYQSKSQTVTKAVDEALGSTVL